MAAQVIGGDYFDFIPMPDGNWAICLGDVSGKGLPASLVMSNVQAIIRVMAMLDTPSSESLRLANKLLYRCTSPEKFVTFFLSRLVGYSSSATPVTILRFTSARVNAID